MSCRQGVFYRISLFIAWMLFAIAASTIFIPSAEAALGDQPMFQVKPPTPYSVPFTNTTQAAPPELVTKKPKLLNVGGIVILAVTIMFILIRKVMIRHERSTRIIMPWIIVFFGIFFIGFLLKDDWYLNNKYVETQCSILDKKFGAYTTSSKTRRGYYKNPEFYVSYHIDGKSYLQWISYYNSSIKRYFESHQEMFDRYDVGKIYPCWYDPRNVDSVVLQRGYDVSSIFLFLVLLLITLLRWLI